jgi:hypothetical protein
MKKHIPTFTDVSEWNFKLFVSTGGTRAKKIVENPDTDIQYFFKGSKRLKDGQFKYPTEFWSEIISSKIGAYFEFDVLDYNIAYNKDGDQKIGCFSKSMTEPFSTKLTEGKKYLTEVNKNYNPDTDKSDYTFQFITRALKRFNLESFIVNIIEIIILDALIGNSDRHQENWGIITNYKDPIQKIEEEISESKNILKFFKEIKKKLIQEAADSEFSEEPKKLRNITDLKSTLADNYFSPIYDSGCCLGREFEEERIVKMIQNPPMIEKYLKKGKSEIHWNDKDGKLNHFDLVKLVSEKYNKEVVTIIDRIRHIFKEENIREIITNIDNNIPDYLEHVKLSENRKELMIKLVTLRTQKLIKLL